MQIAQILSRFTFPRLLVAGLLLAAAAGAQAQTRSMLRSGEALKAGESLVSANRTYTAVMQGDGNLVVYGPRQAVVWASNTGGKPPAPYIAAMQADGNLVVYGPNNAVLWAANTGGRPAGNYFLIMQDDANLALYSGTQPANHSGALWSTAWGIAPPLATQFPTLTPVQAAALTAAQVAAMEKTGQKVTLTPLQQCVQTLSGMHESLLNKYQELSNAARVDPASQKAYFDTELKYRAAGLAVRGKGWDLKTCAETSKLVHDQYAALTAPPPAGLGGCYQAVVQRHSLLMSLYVGNVRRALIDPVESQSLLDLEVRYVDAFQALARYSLSLKDCTELQQLLDARIGAQQKLSAAK